MTLPYLQSLFNTRIQHTGRENEGKRVSVSECVRACMCVGQKQNHLITRKANSKNS
jgi:hypothetical protein